MERHIDPPQEQWERLPTPLTPGERKVFELFDEKLPLEWEMYVQPHLNGLRPDLVLLNPYAGIAVYEIKDWNLNSIQYSIQSETTKNPINKIKLYEEELLELYCPRLNDHFGNAARQTITAGLIFTRLPQAKVESLLVPYRAHRYPGMNTYPEYYPLAGLESLEEGNLNTLFPTCRQWGRQNPSRIMSEDTANDLRGWLKEPAFSQEQREPLELDESQNDIATNRTETGYRRVKGPAGSGKSLALAARAAELASEDKQVLVCTFNITLMSYLRDLVARHTRYLATRHAMRRRVIRQRIEYRNFHNWCKRICINAGYEHDYNQLWTNNQNEEALKHRMAALVSRIYDDPSANADLPVYDAILVDEGQDYELPWWQTLRKAVVSNGEMLLVADKTQNIYGTAQAWTEEAMTGAGFSGRWMELKTSYRLPLKIIPILQRFADQFLINEEVDIPQQLEIEFDTVELRWVQVSSGMPINVCVEEVRRQMQRLRSDTAVPDITFLSGHEMGHALVNEFEQRDVHVINTFGQDDRESRRKKLAFFQGDARVKATTLHSFKGWEARHLVLYVSTIASPEDCALLYTALTRLKKHQQGSLLTVVSSCPELYNFGREWPDFDEITDAN